MASSFSWELFESGRPIKRRYVQIPGDQQKILDGEGAWSDALNHGSHPMLNVPDRVLQDVKDSYIRTQRRSTQHHGHASSSKVTGAPADSVMQERPLSSSLGNDADDDESVISRVSWPPTPTPDHARTRVDAEVMARYAAEAEGSLPSQPQPENSSPPKNQPKRKNPPSIYEPAPSSSALQSEVLEIEPPGFLTQEIQKPVNRAAFRAIAIDSRKPEPTPPSAQLPVTTNQISTELPPSKRQRRMEEIQLSDDEPVLTSRACIAARASQQSLAKPASNETNLTASLSDPSLESHYALDRPTEMLETVSASAPHNDHSSFTPTWEGRRQVDRKVVINVSRPTSACNNPSLTTATIRPPTAAQRTGAMGSSPASIHSLRSSQVNLNMQTPYEMFQAAYPDYDATRRQFVSACLDVNQLRRDKALPEFLYDDYVRAHTEYIIYVTQCSTNKRPRILRGIEWYNQEIADFQYAKKVLRKDNLSAILEAHAEDVQAVERFLGEPQSTDLNSESEASDQDTADTPDEDDGRNIVHEGAEMPDESEAAASPSYHIASPGSQYMRQPAELSQVREAVVYDRLEEARNILDLADAGPQDGDTVDAPMLEELEGNEDPLTELVTERHSLRPPTSSAVAQVFGSARDQSRDSKNPRTPSARRNLVLHGSSRGSRTSFGSGEILQHAPSSPAGSSRASMSVSASHPQANIRTPSTTEPQSVLTKDNSSPKGLDAGKPPVSSPSEHVQTPATQSSPGRAERLSTSTPAPNPPVEEDEEDGDAFEPPLLPPPKKTAQSGATLTAHPSSAETSMRPFNAPPTAPAVRHGGWTPRKSADPKQIWAGTANASSAGVTRPSRSPVSSEISYVGATRSARRRGESREERSSSFKAFLAKKMAKGQLAPGTPNPK